jgi:UDP-N-acetylmuramoylalanine--D-glutamate ligase
MREVYDACVTHPASRVTYPPVPPNYQGQRVVILGLARQGVALARYLAQAGARVVVSDVQTANSSKLAANMAALKDLTIEYVLGAHPLTLLDGADWLFLSGGIAANSPLAQEARRRGVPLSNDSQVFLEVCPPGVIVVGITGSAGKTTTTTLVGRILSVERGVRTSESVGRISEKETDHATRTLWVGGNIGNPLIAEVHRMRAGDVAVMELSSFQLEIMTRSPNVAAVLNITPNHLDRHGTMEAYAAAKSHILLHQSSDDIAVLGMDDSGAHRLASLVQGRLAYFSGERAVDEGAFLRDKEIIFRWNGREQTVCNVSRIQLRGQHNLLNVLAACAISGVSGATPEAMRAGIEGFTGVEHRLEFVRERSGVKWYNDSIASAPERVMAALKSFDEPIVLLAGGRDKKLPWDEFARLAKQRVKHLVLFGEAGPLIQRAIETVNLSRTRYTLCRNLAEAVPVAAGQAERGDVVLLSPGGTSFDEFADFAERGEKFKEWVWELG